MTEATTTLTRAVSFIRAMTSISSTILFANEGNALDGRAGAEGVRHLLHSRHDIDLIDDLVRE
jgi:hypothetical protein